MTISDLIKKLEYIKQEHGDIEIQLQEVSKDGKIINTSQIFTVTEKYEKEVICNIRSWPY